MIPMNINISNTKLENVIYRVTFSMFFNKKFIIIPNNWFQTVFKFEIINKKIEKFNYILKGEEC